MIPISEVKFITFLSDTFQTLNADERRSYAKEHFRIDFKKPVLFESLKLIFKRVTNLTEPYHYMVRVHFLSPSSTELSISINFDSFDSEIIFHSEQPKDLKQELFINSIFYYPEVSQRHNVLRYNDSFNFKVYAYKKSFVPQKTKYNVFNIFIKFSSLFLKSYE